jgi:nicotinate-nucleotide pyrophosphorylase (carboxylating)
LRLLEKAAVVAGGGVNHRVGLADALLVKDNHVAVAGGVAEATRRALAAAGGRHVQVEVTSLAELDEAVDAGARDVLLDNFTPDGCAEAVAHLASRDLPDRVLLEASGTIRLDTVAAFAASGVDRVAVGALTHSAPQLDIALDVRAVEPPADAAATEA